MSRSTPHCCSTLHRRSNCHVATKKTKELPCCHQGAAMLPPWMTKTPEPLWRSDSNCEQSAASGPQPKANSQQPASANKQPEASNHPNPTLSQPEASKHRAAMGATPSKQLSRVALRNASLRLGWRPRHACGSFANRAGCGTSSAGHPGAVLRWGDASCIHHGSHIICIGDIGPRVLFV